MMASMGTQTTVRGLFKAALLGVAVALLTYLGFLAYIRWGQGLPIVIRMLVLAVGGAVSLTFAAAMIFSAETGASMRRMPILRTYGCCFLLLILMFTLKIVMDRLF